MHGDGASVVVLMEVGRGLTCVPGTLVEIGVDGRLNLTGHTRTAYLSSFEARSCGRFLAFGETVTI